MTASDYAVVAGVALIAVGFTAVGWALRMVATGVDEVIGLVERRRQWTG